MIVGTDAPTAAFGDVLIERSAAGRPPPPKLYLVALGINKYGDPKIQPLAFSVADAEAVAEELQSASQGLYTLDKTVVLTDKEVTPQSGAKPIEQLKARAQGRRQAGRPDRVLSGRPRRRGRRHAEVLLRRPRFQARRTWRKESIRTASVGRISAGWPIFLAASWCMLDTCYSGAIQPPRAGDLKDAVRQLQDDVIFTVTAATGEQRSAEKAVLETRGVHQMPVGGAGRRRTDRTAAHRHARRCGRLREAVRARS